MSYFLWIEDFASVTGGEDIAHNVLGGIIDPLKLLGDKKALRRDLKSEGVFIELNFGDGLDFFQDKLADIDYIILDINLPAYSGSEPKDNVLRLLEKWHGYKTSDDIIIDEAKGIAMVKGRIKTRSTGEAAMKLYKHGGLSLMEMLRPWVVLES